MQDARMSEQKVIKTKRLVLEIGMQFQLSKWVSYQNGYL